MRSYVIVLNWNGWKDTIECLESVFRLDYPDLRVVVCDNASEDGSLQKINQWARGELLAESFNKSLSRLSAPAIPKPIPVQELTRHQAESGAATYRSRLVLIQTGANVGFAAGNNVGLRYALGDPESAFFWLLNNDVVVETGSLAAMVKLMDEMPDIGICGSLNISYHHPDEVQVQGGRLYTRWTGRVKTPPSLKVGKLTSCPARMDFVNGASMLASRAFLEQVGLMEESYFLYFEELDWAMRARGKFKLGYSRESVIYHKEGAAIGTNRDRMKRSLLSEKYLSRNRIIFTKWFFPWALPSVFASTFLAALHRLCHGDWERARVIVIWSLRGLFFRKREE
jgi:GT2 family glycosyltransferase